jgi:hypothetical protein
VVRGLRVYLCGLWQPRGLDGRAAEVAVRGGEGAGSINIRAKVAGGAFEFSQHALDQSIQRRISVAGLCEAVASCEVIEDYPGDKYGPSCLLLGFTAAGRPIHVQGSYPSRPLIKIITLYEPDPDLWEDYRRRTS